MKMKMMKLLEFDKVCIAKEKFNPFAFFVPRRNHLVMREIYKLLVNQVV